MVNKKNNEANQEPKQNSLFSYEQEPRKIFDDAEKERILVALLSLKSIKGIGFRTICTLFDENIIPHIFNWSPSEIAERLSKLDSRNMTDVIKAFSTKDSKERLHEQGWKLVKELKTQNILFVPRGDQDYPESLLRLVEPPRWFFCKGSVSALKSKAIVSVVGTRSATIDGQRLAYSCASQLVRKNIVVLSGLAKGIDERAHKGAVDFCGQSIAILGNGLLAIDSQEAKSLADQIIEFDGVVLSEYLPFDSASRITFLRRNELQVALSNVLIPVECPSLESGTGATIRRALNIGTPIVGVISNNSQINENNLSSTRSNLEKLGVRIYSLNNGDSVQFWDFLQSVMSEHDWKGSPVERQNRFFRGIEKQIALAKKRLDLDDSAIDRFSDHIKKLII